MLTDFSLMFIVLVMNMMAQHITFNKTIKTVKIKNFIK